MMVLLQAKAFALSSPVLYSVREEERKPALPLDSTRLLYKTLKFKIQTLLIPEERTSGDVTLS